jgi:hypothetical protein
VSHIRIVLTGAVVDWMREYDITRVEDGHRPGEREWREALAAATPRRAGRGEVFDLSVSPDAARELADELAERAEVESGLPAADRYIKPGTLRQAAERIQAAIPVIR